VVVDRIQIVKHNCELGDLCWSDPLYLGYSIVSCFRRNRGGLYLTIALGRKAQELADVNAVLEDHKHCS
jgi:hypothetical protein